MSRFPMVYQSMSVPDPQPGAEEGEAALARWVA